MLIKKVNEFVGCGQGKFLCVTRPQRFGKRWLMICLMPIIQKVVIRKNYFQILKSLENYLLKVI